MRASKDKVFKCFSRLPSNGLSHRRPGENVVYLLECQLSLHGNAFGLKNAGAIYQRMMIRMFRNKIGNMVEVYIDNMVVKSKENQRHIDDLTEVFEILR